MTRHTANYYMERTLQEHDCLDYRPSMVCASAVILALNNPEIEEYERDLPGLVSLECCVNSLSSNNHWFTSFLLSPATAKGLDGIYTIWWTGVMEVHEPRVKEDNGTDRIVCLKEETWRCQEEVSIHKIFRS